MDNAEIDGAHPSHVLFSPDQKWSPRWGLSFQRLLNLAQLCLDRRKFDLRDKLMHFTSRSPSPGCVIEIETAAAFRQPPFPIIVPARREATNPASYSA
jgi:hypothetical protein